MAAKKMELEMCNQLGTLMQLQLGRIVGTYQSSTDLDKWDKFWDCIWLGCHMKYFRGTHYAAWWIWGRCGCLNFEG